MANISEDGGAPRAEVTEHTYKHTSKVLEVSTTKESKSFSSTSTSAEMT
jgi:hypothetical protein